MSRADRLTLLNSFARVAELGSLTAAARELGLSQPSVTRHIDALETLLDAPLLRRSPHSVTLTPAGEAALVDARAMLAAWNGFAERHGASDALRGELRVFVPIALGQTVLAETAATFQRRFPEVRLDWRLTDAPINMVAEGADLWVRVGEVPDDRLVVRSLCRIARRAVIAPGADPTRMIALGDFETSAPTLQSNEGRRYTPQAKTVFRSNNFMAVFTQVLAGAGFAILPDWFTRADLASGRLAELAPGYSAPSIGLSLAFLPGPRPARLEALLDHVQKTVAKIA